MANWSARSSGYKLGILLLFLGTAFYVIGFGSPYWIKVDVGYGSFFFSGLWMGCYKPSYGSSVTCDAVNLSIAPGWYKATVALQTIGLILLCVSCMYCFIFNCCLTSSPTQLSQSKFVEWLAFLGGFLAFIGMMIYVGKTVGATHYSDNYFWAFGFDLSGCILAIVTSILLFKTRSPPSENPTAVTGTTVLMQGQTYPPAGTTYGPSPYVPGTTLYQYPSAQAQGYPPASTPQGYAGYPPTSTPQGYSAGYPPTSTAQGHSGYSAPSAPPLGYSGSTVPFTGYSATTPPPSYDVVVSGGYSAPADHSGDKKSAQ